MISKGRDQSTIIPRGVGWTNNSVIYTTIQCCILYDEVVTWLLVGVPMEV